MGPGVNEQKIEILLNTIRSYESKPFKWGSNDCALFVADVLKQTTGKDYAKDFRGKYKSKTGASKALKKFGKGSLKKTMLHFFGKPINVNFAKRGDVAYLESENGPTVGIVVDHRVALVGPDGVVYNPLKNCSMAWSI